jgi:branched-chain amino acid aminotransferase
VIQIAKEFGFQVEEKYFKPQDIYEAQEAFFCGTAVEVTAIRSLDDRIIANGGIGEVTKKIKARYDEIIHGEASGYHEALTWVPISNEVVI